MFVLFKIYDQWLSKYRQQKYHVDRINFFYDLYLEPITLFQSLFDSVFAVSLFAINWQNKSTANNEVRLYNLIDERGLNNVWLNSRRPFLTKTSIWFFNNIFAMDLNLIHKKKTKWSSPSMDKLRPAKFFFADPVTNFKEALFCCWT